MRALPLVTAALLAPALLTAAVMVAPAPLGDAELAAGPVVDPAGAAGAAAARAPEAEPAGAAPAATPLAAPAVAGADAAGPPLSPVAQAGPDGPPLPDASGSGRRLVFSRQAQRVWAVEADGAVVRTWLVSGSTYGNDLPGTYQVFSRARWTPSFTGGSQLQWFVGFYRTPRDNVIGFHEIPRTAAGLIHGNDLLGTPRSSGCIRQATEDAEFVFHWAPEGTVVVVV